LQLVKIAKRKIQARQYDQANEGKIKFKTPDGYRRPDDKTWLIQLYADVFIFMPDATMQYLAKHDEQEDKPGG